MKATKSKSKARAKQPKSTRWSRLTSPLRLLLVLVLTFGISSVGRAAEKIKRGIKNKKSSWKASYAALLNAKAWAYFRPAWHKTDGQELTPQVDGVDHVLDDPDSRIESDFHIPSGLRTRVAFWVDVYARFTSEYRILHDKDNPELIYGYLDFRPLYRSLPKPIARARAHQIEQRVTKELKERIAEAMEVTKPRAGQEQLTPEEKTEIRGLLARFDIRTAADAQRPLRRVRAQTGQKDAFLKGVARSDKLIADVEQVFREQKLPLALARLPFVESSYNRAAVSKDGAIGMWQFLPETARRFAPHSSWRELSDPLRQSKSAARMFTILHEKFDDWGLAVTAYNSGAVRVKRIADSNRAPSIEKLIRVPLKRGNLGFAGNNFYCEFLAALYVQNYKDRLFSDKEVQIAKIDMPRRVQSLLSSQAAAERAPQSIPRKGVRKKASAKHAIAKSKRHSKRRLKLAAAHPRKKIRAPKASVRKVAYRPRPSARRA